MPEFFNEFPGPFVGHRLFYICLTGKRIYIPFACFQIKYTARSTYANYKEDKAACLKSSTSLVSL